MVGSCMILQQLMIGSGHALHMVVSMEANVARKGIGYPISQVYLCQSLRSIRDLHGACICVNLQIVV